MLGHLVSNVAPVQRIAAPSKLLKRMATLLLSVFKPHS